MSGSVISVNTNPTQMKAIAQLTRMSAVMNRSMERLATGYKINRASDDPAGMMAVENIKAEEKALKAQIEALDREEYRTGAREGAASVVSDLVSDLDALVLAAANTGGTTEAEREAMQIEADSILQAIDFVSNTTRFNGEQVITGYTSRNLGQITVPSTEPGGEGTSYSLADLARGGKLSLLKGDMDIAQQVVEAANSGMATERGGMGLFLRDQAAKRDALVTQLEEVTKTKSLIADTDYAKETAELIRARVLQDVAVFVTKMSGDQNANTVFSLISGAAAGGTTMLGMPR
jgi:flagellin